MDLVDRYVYAVKRHLPAAQQDDIVNELTDDILSQIKDKEEELGRPLDEGEQESILKHYGHPYLLATRYRPQQHLIGPALFPFYFPALKIALALAFGIQVIVAFSIGLAQRAPERILPHIVQFPGAVIPIVFWVTLAFAVADYCQARLKLFENWSPRTLPPVGQAKRPPNRGSLVAELVINILFFAWWLALPTYPFLMFGPAASMLSFSPAWSRLYYVAPLPAVGSTLMVIAALVRPAWASALRIRPLTMNLLGLFVVSVAINAGPLVVPTQDTPELVRLVRGINEVTRAVLVIISLITMIQLVVSVVRLVRSPRESAV
jgi:hypothetical protein